MDLAEYEPGHFRHFIRVYEVALVSENIIYFFRSHLTSIKIDFSIIVSFYYL